MATEFNSLYRELAAEGEGSGEDEEEGVPGAGGSGLDGVGGQGVAHRGCSRLTCGEDNLRRDFGLPEWARDGGVQGCRGRT